MDIDINISLDEADDATADHAAALIAQTVQYNAAYGTELTPSQMAEQLLRDTLESLRVAYVSQSVDAAANPIKAMPRSARLRINSVVGNELEAMQ